MSAGVARAHLVGVGVAGEDHVDAVLVQDGLHLLLEALHLLEVRGPGVVPRCKPVPASSGRMRETHCARNTGLA